MPATTKTALLDVTHKEFAKLTRLIAAIPTSTAMRQRDQGTSIKDVIAHRAHWITLFLGWYADGLAGKTVHFPAEGYKWNDLIRFNADLRRQQVNVDWPRAVAMLQDGHATLLDFLETATEAMLYGAPMKGANNAWTTGRWAEAAGPSHYRSASKYIRACLKTDR